MFDQLRSNQPVQSLGLLKRSQQSLSAPKHPLHLVRRPGHIFCLDLLRTLSFVWFLPDISFILDLLRTLSFLLFLLDVTFVWLPLDAKMFRKQAKVTKAPSSVIQSSNLSTQATTSLSSGATSSTQSVSTARQVTDDFERSKSNILHDFEYIILPKTKLLDELFKRQNIRLSRINSSIDMYFATEEVVREKLARFRKQWIATDHYREMQDVVDKLSNHLIDIQSNIYRK